MLYLSSSDRTTYEDMTPTPRNATAPFIPSRFVPSGQFQSLLSEFPHFEVVYIETKIFIQFHADMSNDFRV